MQIFLRLLILWFIPFRLVVSGYDNTGLCPLGLDDAVLDFKYLLKKFVLGFSGPLPACLSGIRLAAVDKNMQVSILQDGRSFEVERFLGDTVFIEDYQGFDYSALTRDGVLEVVVKQVKMNLGQPDMTDVLTPHVLVGLRRVNEVVVLLKNDASYTLP